MGSVFPLDWGSIPSSPVGGRSYGEPQGLSGPACPAVVTLETLPTPGPCVQAKLRVI